jgi:hypothetical protein
MVEDSVCRPPCGSAKLLKSHIDKYDFMSLKQVDGQRQAGWPVVLPQGMMLFRRNRHFRIVLRWRLALRSGASLHRGGLTEDSGDQLPRAFDRHAAASLQRSKLSA